MNFSYLCANVYRSFSKSWKVINRNDYILLWFKFHVNWHLSNNRYHILYFYIITLTLMENLSNFHKTIYIWIDWFFDRSWLIRDFYQTFVLMLFLSDIATYLFMCNGNMLVSIAKPSTIDHHKNLNPKLYLQHPCIHVSWYKWCGVIHNKYFNLSCM